MRSDGGLVDDISCKTLAIQRAIVFGVFWTIARLGVSGGAVLFQDLFIVSVYNGSHIIHARVTEFYCIPVKDFVKLR